jgi:tetratricopeptide (TPR) repeat protein
LDKEVILIKILYKKAYNLYLDECFEDSLKLLIQTSEIWFDHHLKIKFLYLQGMNFFKLKNFERALRIFYELAILIPRNPKIFFMLGEISYSLGNYKESERMYSKAKKCDYFNFDLTLKTALSAWKSDDYLKMYKRLKEGYIPEIISKEEELKLKKFLLDFLANSNYSKTYSLVKKFRKWCNFRKKQTLKKPINKSNI